jgi:hypothetical protein
MGDDARWKQVESLFQRAVEMEAGSRDEYLRAACGDDEELRKLVESLLAHDASATAAAPVEKPKVGYQIGPYEIVSLLGRAEWARCTWRATAGWTGRSH